MSETIQDHLWEALSEILEDPANVILNEHREAGLKAIRLAQEHQDLKSWAVVQEGGSSAEFYLHVHDSLEAAEDDRIACTVDGAYRTSEPFEVPTHVMKVDPALLPYVFGFVDDCMQATYGVSCVDVPDDYELEEL